MYRSLRISILSLILFNTFIFKNQKTKIYFLRLHIVFQEGRRQGPEIPDNSFGFLSQPLENHHYFILRILHILRFPPLLLLLSRRWELDNLLTVVPVKLVY